MPRTDNKNFTMQESNHPAMGVAAYGGTALLSFIPRAMHCNTGDSYICTFADGSRQTMVLNEGATYPYSVIGISKVGGASIAVASKFVLYLV